MLLAIVASIALGTPAVAPASISSQHALFSPQLHRGQVLTWFGSLTSYYLPSNPESHSDLLACSVNDRSQRGFTMARRVRAFLSNQPHTPPMEHPAIIIGDGHEYKLDGSPLNDDPICLVYSPAMFGSPPGTLKVGTTWRFSRSADFGYLRGLRGTATVTNVDPKTNTVSLHIGETSIPSVVIDMTVSDGGVIRYERDRWYTHRMSSAPPRTFAELTDTVTWTLQSQSLMGLWRYPPSEVVPFPDHGLPDIFDPNGRFISISRLTFTNPPVTLIRIWHFGPFTPQSLIPPPPNFRDVLLILGAMLLAILVCRAAILYVSIAGQSIASPGTRKRQLYMTGAVALIAAAGSMWWVYH